MSPTVSEIHAWGQANLIFLAIARATSRAEGPAIPQKPDRFMQPPILRTSISKILLVALVGFLAGGLLGCSPHSSPSAVTESSGALAGKTSIDMETRAISHALGVAKVPKRAKRVVVLDTAALDAAVAVGVKPIGSITFGDLPAYLDDKVSGIAIVGQSNQPNLEAVLRLEPDLILSNQISSGSIYPQLTRIAPTVLTVGSGRAGEWQENFRLYARALGKTTEAERVLQAYQRCADRLRQKLENPEQIQVSTVVTGTGQIGFYSAKSFSGSVLADLGFTRPSIQAEADLHGGIISREDLESIDGDAIFLVTSAAFPSSLSLQEFVSNPLWSRLSAVRQGRIYAVENEVWGAGRSVLAAQQILKDVAQAFLESGINSRGELAACLSENSTSHVR